MDKLLTNTAYYYQIILRQNNSTLETTGVYKMHYINKCLQDQNKVTSIFQEGNKSMPICFQQHFTKFRKEIKIILCGMKQFLKTFYFIILRTLDLAH